LCTALKIRANIFDLDRFQCFGRIAVPLIPATARPGPPIEDGPELRRIAVVPLIAPLFGAVGLTNGFA
jgi:hypothetical protein